MYNKIYYIYLDKTTNLNKIFYVGKGQLKRVKSKQDRNMHWRAIVNKYGWSINNRELVLATKDHKYAQQMEIYYIKLYKTFEKMWEDGSGWGANYTIGGDGTSGFVGGMKGKNHTKKSSEKISNSKLEFKHPCREKVTEIMRKYISGNYSARQLSEEYHINKRTVERIINGNTWKDLIDKDIMFLLKKQSIKNKTNTNLTLAQAEEIRKKYVSKLYTYNKLAIEYGSNINAIYRIINNLTFRG